MTKVVQGSVDLVALAARLPVGLGADAAAAAIRSGISRIHEHPFLLDGAGDPLRCARDPLIDQGARGPERLYELTCAALGQMARQLPADALRGTLVLLALPEVRPGFSMRDARVLLSSLQTEVMPAGWEIEACGEGHAGMLQGLGHASRLLAEGVRELCVVAGVDSYLDADTLHWLDAQRRLVRAGSRGGFLPGEGASMIAIASSIARQRLGLASLGRVRASSCAMETRSLETPEGLFGEGLTAAVRTVVETLGADEEISDVFPDINGERHRAEDWGFTLLRCPERIRNGTVYTTAVAQCGDVGAATGGLHVIRAVRAWQRDYANGGRALAFAGSWHGLRAAAILESEWA